MNSLDKHMEDNVGSQAFEMPSFEEQMKKIANNRKNTPIFSGVLMYFPDALKAIAQCSFAGNQQHNPDKPLHWDRDKSGDEKDALTRHLIEAGSVDSDGIRHSAKVAWRALANLQKELEDNGEATLSQHNLKGSVLRDGQY